MMQTVYFWLFTITWGCFSRRGRLSAGVALAGGKKLTIHGITHNGASLHHQITLIQGSKRTSLYSLSTGIHQHTGLVV
ncbi:MAG: hypothetical protein KIG60_10410, partial [Caryophanon sp.]|nr:hypothetical protein [Caryophanon sp.]